MIQTLETLIQNYDFSYGDIDLNKTLQDILDYMKNQESDIKSLQDIIDIQRHNLSLYRQGKLKGVTNGKNR